MSARSWAPLAGLLAVALGLAYWLGVSTAPPAQSYSGDRLGPETGQSVQQYLEHAATSLAQATPDQRHWALVSPSTEWTPAQVWARLGRVDDLDRIARVLIKVPITGVQSPVVDVPTGQNASAFDAVDEIAAQSLPSVVAPGDRGAAIARVSAARLRSNTPAVVGVVVRGTVDALRTVGEIPGVRAVEVAPPDGDDLAVAPLLPAHRDVVGPLADDQPVPER